MTYETYKGSHYTYTVIAQRGDVKLGVSALYGHTGSVVARIVTSEECVLTPLEYRGPSMFTTPDDSITPGHKHSVLAFMPFNPSPNKQYFPELAKSSGLWELLAANLGDFLTLNGFEITVPNLPELLESLVCSGITSPTYKLVYKNPFKEYHAGKEND